MQYKASSSSCNSHKKYSRRLHIPRVQLVLLACHQEQPMKNKIQKNQQLCTTTSIIMVNEEYIISK